ncbi:TetR/AcrR family transcriptional regulator [Dysgonomonas sp. 25]|uniref:TetR/AcrR family transcriptional regulator n=1 Tax=Dysgonomonas sp. 25 TaxID=2302933 RepID=UPI0013D7E446|nr:TetR/AcrR family transcriptional regulator [Dysgonomonas sp. 25]
MKQRKIGILRRTNYELDKTILDSTKALIEECGVAKLTFTAITAKANVAPMVVYNRFGDLEGVLDKLVEKDIEWFTDILDDAAKSRKKLTSKAYLKRVLKAFIMKLYKDKYLRQIIAWELSENNNTITRSLAVREFMYRHIISEYMLELKDKKGIDVNLVLAFLFGGIYYIMLIKDKHAYWGIDFNLQNSKKDLHDLVDKICDLIFSYNTSEKDVIEMNTKMKIATNMKKEGLTSEMIAKITGLEIELIQGLQ